MTVYVDDMFKYPMGRFGRMRMSHMMADTEPELHAMAARIGVARKWYQGDHYDICMSKRDAAVAAGAREISLSEMAAFAAVLRWYGRAMDPGTARNFLADFGRAAG